MGTHKENTQVLESSHSQKVAFLQNHIDSLKDVRHKKDNEILELKQELQYLRQQKDSGPVTEDGRESKVRDEQLTG